ncbi:MAG: galactokinase [Leptospira sp.]|nr:galactokinase [Leptospira sp.]
MLNEVFKKQFGNGIVEPISYRAPARINIIGEHVDYLGGIVLPAAINFEIIATLRANDKSSFRLYSKEYSSFWESDEITKSDKSPWANYIMGVVDQLEARGFHVPGFDMAIGGNIPQGSGLSSSAALEVVVGYALNDLFSFGLSKKDIALIGQAAENEFVGTRCGIMDQFIIAHGKKDHCISLNTETLEFSYHKFDMKDYEFSLIQSNVKHSLNDSAYNTRRSECESALSKIQKFRKEKNLSPISHLYQLDWNIDVAMFELTDEESKRVAHVLSEKERTERTIKGLESGNFQDVGSALTECHWSLSQDFEVSCKETDFLVNSILDSGSLGARMIGGGFGGCVLVLDKKGAMKEKAREVRDAYYKKFQLEPDFYLFEIADGVGKL